MNREFFNVYTIISYDRLTKTYNVKENLSGEESSFIFDETNRNNNTSKAALLLYDSLFIPDEKREHLNEATVVKDMMSRKIRFYRNNVLKQTDIYLSVADYPIDNNEREEIKRFRSLLRDITKQEGFPENVEWPAIPQCISDSIDHSFLYVNYHQLDPKLD